MREVAKRKGVLGYVWRMQDGTDIAPADMKTTHLFYSLRMIWNHSMPPELQIEGGRYNLGLVSNKTKTAEAIINLSSELSTRNPRDLSSRLMYQWKFMLDNADRASKLLLLEN